MQALVVLSLLSAREIPSTFVIGAHTDPEFVAHAWVEHAGVPVLPAEGFREYILLAV